MMSMLTETIDFRNLIEIAEGKLLIEALTDEQKQRAQAIIDKYSNIVDNLPSRSQNDLRGKLDQLQAGIDAPAAGSEEPETDSQEEPETDQDTETPSTDEIVSTLKDAMSGLGTDEGAVYNVLRKLDNKSQWDAVVQAYPEVYDDINGDFSGSELEDVKQLLSNIGVTMPGDEQSAEEPEQEPAGQTQQEPNQSSWNDRIKAAGEPTNASEAAAFVTNIPENKRGQYRAQLSPEEQEMFDRMASGET